MGHRVDHVRPHIHRCLRAGCAEDHALARVEGRLRDVMTDREAFELVCHVAAIPEQHAAPIISRHFRSGRADLEALLDEIGGDRDPGILRAIGHLKPRMRHEEIVAMLVDQLGLPPLDVERLHAVSREQPEADVGAP